MTKAQQILTKFAGIHESAVAYVERMKAEQLKKVISTPEQYAQYAQQNMKATQLADHAMKLNLKSASK
ncbi:MAG: hypothetical protein WC666_04205 [Candidatus Paceibacterota bacterium]|jgi:hypothetical protein